MRAAGQRLLAAVLAAQRHQAGHFLLGEADFLAAELGERQVLHFVGSRPAARGGVERMQFLGNGRH